MEINGIFNPMSAKRARDVLGVTSEFSKRSLNVLDFGAKMDGTDDSAAFNAARAACLPGGTINVPPGQFVVGTNPTAGPSSPVVWKLSGNCYGNGTFPVTQIGTDIVVNTLDSGTNITTYNPKRRDQGSVRRADVIWDYSDPGPASFGTSPGVETNGYVAAGRFPHFVCDLTGWLWAGLIERISQDQRSWR